MDKKELEEVKELFNLSVQVLAIIAVLVLLVVDKGMGKMAQPIPDLWYGLLFGFGVAGKMFLEYLLSKIK